MHLGLQPWLRHGQGPRQQAEVIKCSEVDQWHSGPERRKELERPRAPAVEDRDQIGRFRHWPSERCRRRKLYGLLRQRQAAFGRPERQ